MIKFEVENKPPIVEPSEKQVRQTIARLRSFGPSSFAVLGDDEGNYVQVAGGGITCMLERRDSTGGHYRGYKESTNLNYPDGTRLVFGAGDVIMQSDEWFLETEVAEVFCAFLSGQTLPDFAKWREYLLNS